jgi:molecular chaperone IbpA
MVNYTWEQFTPFTLGLDETFSRLETFAGSGTNYPPYNIYNGSDSRTILEVALAGFSEKDISVESERNLLTISANKSSKEDRKYSYKGISNKNFSRNWQLGDNVEVESVNFADGLLTVTLLKELPDNQKHKKHF